MRMYYNQLGNTGLKVSALGYGSWVSFGNQMETKDCKALMTKAREAGINFFDSAEVYANGRAEEIIGEVIKECKWKRSDLVITTKIFWGGSGPNDKGLSRKHIIEGTRGCLRRLQMDYVDIMLAHRPDASTPIEETVRAMNYIIDNGWAYYWGTSEWSAQQITESWEIARRLGMSGPAVEEPEYNLLSREKVEVEFMPLYQNYGLGVCTWSPLASGVLTGKYSGGVIPPGSRFSLENYSNLASRSLLPDVLNKIDSLKPIAKEMGVTMPQLGIGWCLANQSISTVITGATKTEQLVENLKALEVVDKLKPDLMDRIESTILSRPRKPEVFR